MKFFKAYLRELIKTLGIVGIPFLLLSAYEFDGLALYGCWVASLMALAGPLLIVMKERETK